MKSPLRLTTRIKSNEVSKIRWLILCSASSVAIGMALKKCAHRAAAAMTSQFQHVAYLVSTLHFLPMASPAGK
jgi:hypothetical protein